ncbi:hypothetical protein F2P79_024803 [Pimephales promelas]|nr:hypothetical protein F2P79_024803 [Pimephales promelas]
MKQKFYHDQHARKRQVTEGDHVYTKNFGSGPIWVPGTVKEQTGPVSCTVALGNGQIVRRHIDQVRNRPVGPSEETSRKEGAELTSIGGVPISKDTPHFGSPTSIVGVTSFKDTNVEQTEAPTKEELRSEHSVVQDKVPLDNVELRRSTRTKKSPRYLQDYELQNLIAEWNIPSAIYTRIERLRSTHAHGTCRV